MRHLFIINPAAGRPESTARLEPLLSRLSFPHEVAYTREAGDAQRLAATAVRTGGPVRIYACGGDGPLNEVVNGAAGFDNAAVTCVPKGTGNDFLKLFGPRFRELFYDLEALAAGPQRAFDLMDCNGKLGLTWCVPAWTPASPRGCTDIRTCALSPVSAPIFYPWRSRSSSGASAVP